MSPAPQPSSPVLRAFASVRLALLSAALLCPGFLAASPQPHHLVLISIDGLAAADFHDPQFPFPNLRQLAREGAVAKALTVSNPTITWPNHTTLVTGVHPLRHGVLHNGSLVRGPPGGPVAVLATRDQGDLIQVPTLFDVLHQAGQRTAGINWPCTRGSPTLDDNFPDTPDLLAHTTPRLRAELRVTGILPSADSVAFRRWGAERCDEIWTAAAVHMLRTRPPRLLMLHLLAPDDAQHRTGPRSPGARAALAHADALVGTVLLALEQTGLTGNSAVVVVSDHGFESVNRLVNPNVILRKAGLTRPGRRRAQAVSQGGTAFLYLTAAEDRETDRQQVHELLRDLPGIQQILDPEAFAALQLPTPNINPQMGDLLLVAEDGYAFADDPYDDYSSLEFSATAGSHGNLATEPRMAGVFVARGRGIRPTSLLGTIRNIDVAPTLAALLGTRLPDADGRVLHEILEAPPPPTP